MGVCAHQIEFAIAVNVMCVHELDGVIDVGFEGVMLQRIVQLHVVEKSGLVVVEIVECVLHILRNRHRCHQRPGCRWRRRGRRREVPRMCEAIGRRGEEVTAR